MSATPPGRADPTGVPRPRCICLPRRHAYDHPTGSPAVHRGPRCRRVADDAPTSVEAYLDPERSAPKEKSESLDGGRVQISGASYEHVLTVSNINAALHPNATR